MPIVQTVDKCFDLLECLAAREGGMGTRELARQLKLNVTTVHNLASTLVKKGYLHQDPGTKKFSIGTRFLLLGQHARLYESLTKAAHPLMVELAAKLDESVMLSMLDRGRAINIDYIPSSQALRVQEPEVLGVLAYCTAVGKISLSSMTGEELEHYFREFPPRQHTENSITSLQAIRETVFKVRANGYAETRDELVLGGSALAVPILDVAGRKIAALGASAPSIRLQGQERKKTLSMLKIYAEKIAAVWF